MRFDELNWMDVEQYLKKDDRLILVVGATEQHAYLSLSTDTKIPQALANAAAKQTGVLVAPSVNFGCSPYFLAYPGTISLRVTTLLAVIEDIIRSAYYQGFRRFLVLNGHGGNMPVRALLSELNAELKDMTTQFYSWWMTKTVGDIAEKHGLQQAHANWEEAFPFTKVADMPQDPKPMVQIVGTQNPEKEKELLGDGSFGGKYEVSDEIMEEVFDSCLKDILKMLEFK